MLEKIQGIIAEVGKGYADKRVKVFDVQAEGGPGNVALRGRVLDAETLADLRSSIECREVGEVETSGVQVLRTEQPRLLSVATNLTGLFAEPSWLAEQVSQLLFGWKLEILEERGRWAFVRQADGYLGWAYLPYLSEHPAAEPTHIVVAPVCLVRNECPQSSDILGRIWGGTAIQVVSINGACAEVDAQAWGWVPRGDVRALEDMPRSAADRRALLAQDASRLIGVPYLWGGCTAAGIDCSGFAQLLHRWIGITIPRDADMQYDAGRKIEPPFQPGDLLFFGGDDGKPPVTHVGISLGGWRIIHSSRSRNGVYIDEVQEVAHLRDSFLGAASYI